MQRLATILALLFALAAIGGTGASYAAAYATVTVETSSPAACAEGTNPVVVSFKLCGKVKSTGVITPCPQPVGVLAVVDDLRQPIAPQAHVAIATTRSTAHPGELWLRPPKAA